MLSIKVRLARNQSLSILDWKIQTKLVLSLKYFLVTKFVLVKVCCIKSLTIPLASLNQETFDPVTNRISLSVVA